MRVGLIADVALANLWGGSTQARIEEMVGFTNFVYENQLNIRLKIEFLDIHTAVSSAPAYAGLDCFASSLNERLDKLAADTSMNYKGAIVHILSGCHPFATKMIGGLAWKGMLCDDRYNKGIDLAGWTSWQVFAHEVGHNIGGSHSFEEGQGFTGGIMDYELTGIPGLQGLKDWEYQFNKKYRKDEICDTLDNARTGLKYSAEETSACKKYFYPMPYVLGKPGANACPSGSWLINDLDTPETECKRAAVELGLGFKHSGAPKSCPAPQGCTKSLTHNVIHFSTCSGAKSSEHAPVCKNIPRFELRGFAMRGSPLVPCHFCVIWLLLQWAFFARVAGV